VAPRDLPAQLGRHPRIRLGQDEALDGGGPVVEVEPRPRPELEAVAACLGQQLAARVPQARLLGACQHAVVDQDEEPAPGSVVETAQHGASV
jgi:hypothetical protein